MSDFTSDKERRKKSTALEAVEALREAARHVRELEVSDAVAERIIAEEIFQVGSRWGRVKPPLNRISPLPGFQVIYDRSRITPSVERASVNPVEPEDSPSRAREWVVVRTPNLLSPEEELSVSFRHMLAAGASGELGPALKDFPEPANDSIEEPAQDLAAEPANNVQPPRSNAFVPALVGAVAAVAAVGAALGVQHFSWASGLAALLLSIAAGAVVFALVMARKPATGSRRKRVRSADRAPRFRWSVDELVDDSAQA